MTSTKSELTLGGLQSSSSPRILDGLKRFSTSSASPKAQFLSFDNAVLSEADSLIGDCESYIIQAKSSLTNLPFAAINEWRKTRKDEQLLLLFDSLQPRIQQSERLLREMLEKTSHTKQVLRKEAKDFQVQLEACIEHSKEELSKTEPVVDSLRDYVDLVSSASSSIKFMMQFNDEVSRQRICEQTDTDAAPQLFFRQPSSLNDNFDVSGDEDHVSLAEKLSTLRKMRERAMTGLAKVLQQKESCTQNLTGCTMSKDAIDGILKRDVGSQSVGASSPRDKELDARNIYKTYVAGEECVKRFDEAANTSSLASTRLQKLVEIRERLLEMDSTFERPSITSE